jgi:hypothetical protein
MGGQAFGDLTRRYDRDEYEKFSNRVLSHLHSLFPDVTVLEIPFYFEKQTFGDMDILVESDNLPNNWVEKLISFYKLKEGSYQKNSNVFSFVYRQFQIDLIVTSSKYIRSSYYYFAYNDLGNLIGRISHKMGLKIGHKGLSIILRDPENDNHQLGEIELTQDFFKGLEIIGLDGKRYNNGFDNLEQIFEYVASSHYFDPEIYLLHNRNHAAKIRDRKRKTYSEFLDWCASSGATANYKWPEVSDRGGYNIREPWFTDVICAHFPEAKQKVDAIIAQYEMDKKFKEKFNGKIVMELTGLQGKELGEFMKYAKERLLITFPKDHIIKTGEREVKRYIRGIYEFRQQGWDWPVIPEDYAKTLYGTLGK